MRRVLVTAISGDIANGILKILRESEQAFIVGCDVTEYPVGMDKVDVFRRSALAVSEGYPDEMLALCQEFGITHMIPANEREIAVISPIRSRFAAIGVKLVIQDAGLLDICLDKYKTMRFLSQAGFDVPNSFVRGDRVLTSPTGYIQKPRRSNGSRSLRRFSPTDVIEEIPDDCILQEYVPGEEYTIGVFRANEHVSTICFKRQLKNGYSFLVELVHDAGLTSLAKRIAKALDLTGYINIQLRRHNDRDFIFEINPRISGTVRFRHLLGFSDVLWWLDLVDGRAVPDFEDKHVTAVGIRELNEKFLLVS